MDIGILICLLRKKKGWSQGQLAHKMGISQGHISVLERGATPVSERNKKEISKALGLPMEMFEMYGLEREDVPPSKRALFDILHPLMQQMIERFLV